MVGWWKTGIFWCESTLIEQALMLLLLGYTRRSWAGWSCHSFALEMKTCHFNCNALIRKREGGAEVFSLFLWGFLVWGRSADWPQSSQLLWMGVAGNAWTGVIPELLTLCSASSELLADWCECRALIYCSSQSLQLPFRKEFFLLVWRQAVQTVLSSLPVRKRAPKVSRVMMATTCKNAA